jgi:RNA polymerase sigma factor (sigma-70 family)
MDDAGLVRAAVGGDRSAFADIYDRYADRVHAFATSVLRDPDEAADVTQDTFLVAARRLDQLRDPSRLRPWLFAIARHEAFRRAKKRSRHVVTDELDEQESTERSAEDVMTSQDAVTIVHAAAAGLTERDRAVLDLSLRHGLEGEELGAAMGISAGHASVLAGRVRDRVEKSLGALLVARLGRDDCTELQKVLGDWDGAFSPLVRKRVARHVEGCATCSATKKRVASPAALLASAPIVVAPASLRTRALDAFDAHAASVSSGSPSSSSSGSGSDPGSTSTSSSHEPGPGDATGAEADGHADTNVGASGDASPAPRPPTSPTNAPPPSPAIHLRRDGFPRSESLGRKAVAVAAVLLLLLGLVGVGIALTGDDDGTQTLATGGQADAGQLIDADRNLTVVDEDKADEAPAPGEVATPTDPADDPAEDEPDLGGDPSPDPGSGGGGSGVTVPPTPPPPPPPPADTSPPSVSAYPGSSTIRALGCGSPTTTTIFASAADPSGIASVSLSPYGGAMSGGGGSYSRSVGNFAAMGPGSTPINFTVTATDTAGNSAATTTSVIVIGC